MLISHICCVFAGVIFLIGFVHQSQQYANTIIAKANNRSQAAARKGSSHRKIPISFQSTRYTLIMLVFINIVLNIIRVINDVWSHNIFSILAIAVILSAILTTLFSLFQYFRIYYTFMNSAYALSKCNNVLLMITLGLNILSYVIICLLFIIFAQIGDSGKDGHGSTDPYLHSPQIRILYFVSLFTLCLTPTIVSFIVMTLFCIKLWKISLIGQINRHSKFHLSNKSSYSTNGKVKMNENENEIKNGTLKNQMIPQNTIVSVTLKQQAFLNIIAKQTLLSCFQTLIFFYVFNEIIGTFDEWGVVYCILYVFMRVLWILSMWLSFIFAQKQYKFFCGCCHKFCLKCCVNLAKNSIQRGIKRQNQKCQSIQNPSLNEPLLEIERV